MIIISRIGPSLMNNYIQLDVDALNVGETNITHPLNPSVTNTNKQSKPASNPSKTPSTSTRVVKKPKFNVAIGQSSNIISSTSTTENNTRINGGLPTTSSRGTNGSSQSISGLPSTSSRGSVSSQSRIGLPTSSSSSSSNLQHGGSLLSSGYPSGLSSGLDSWGSMLGLTTNSRQDQERTEPQLQDQNNVGLMRSVQIGYKRPLISGNTNSYISGYTTSTSNTIGNRPINFYDVMNSRNNNGKGSIGSNGSGYNGSGNIGRSSNSNDDGEGNVNGTGISDSSTISKSDPNMIDPKGKRILNPEGLNTPSRSLLLEDLVIDDVAYERLKSSITYEGYVGKHADNTKTWVYVTNNNNEDKTW